MAGILSQAAWQKLIDEDIEWLLSQKRTLEREHIHELLKWLRENKPKSKHEADNA